MVAALGVVFGDIGTSPLYALRVIFGPFGQHLGITEESVLGVVSLVFWTITLVVSVKYVTFVMRTDNRGEGGIMALVSLVRNSLQAAPGASFFVFLGLIGVALFYGDSAVTPAISVLSAVEGLKVAAPSLHTYVLPITMAILAALFWIQKYGTAAIGRIFGPMMVLWFTVIGVAGAWQIGRHPTALTALSPVSAVAFFTAHPGAAFLAMGAVVLAVTGAEALYADLGHFGRKPISRAWFFFVFPALTLCYVGQGALMLHQPSAASDPFYFLFPAALRLPAVFLATLATLIASQSVISGAFSLTRQAIHLDFLPRMLVQHTSTREIGQIYIPAVNILLFIIIAILVLVFGSSENLANAYGVAVSGTLLIDTLLFLAVTRLLHRYSTKAAAVLAVLFVPLDTLLVLANLSKIAHGGWLPIGVAVGTLLVMTTWIRGQRITTAERRDLEEPLKTFVKHLHNRDPAVARVPGQAVYIAHHPGRTPLALRATVDELRELHQKVAIVYVRTSSHAHVPEDKRAEINDLGFRSDGISQVILTFGFHDSPNIPDTLSHLRHHSNELNFNPKRATYFVSRARIMPTKRRNLALWRKSLYRLLARNTVNSSDYYHLPTDHTIEMSSLIKL